MRFIYPILLLCILVFVCATMFSTYADSDPKKTADTFLAAVQKGDYKETVRLFGGNTCRCPKKGGWVSYLVYASSQEPNLAFAMGRPFQFKNATVAPVAHPGKTVSPLPWQRPEDVVVDLDISFDQSRYMPMFLPLKMAYGIPMTKEEFDAFLKDPDKECRQGFTLRLRPSLAPGTVARPEGSKGIEYKPTDEKATDVNRNESISLEDKKRFLRQLTDKLKSKENGDASRQDIEEHKNGKAERPLTFSTEKNKRSTDVNRKAALSQSGAGVNETTGISPSSTQIPPNARTDEAGEEDDDSFVLRELEQAIRETQGEEVATYLHPKDAGPVKLKDGTEMKVEDIARALPRLKSSKLRLHIVRREKLRQWTVYHFGLMYPVVQMQDGTTIELKSHRTPSGELPAEPDSTKSKHRAGEQ